MKSARATARPGAIFDDMKTWNPAQHPGVAAVARKVEQTYAGAERLF